MEEKVPALVFKFMEERLDGRDQLDLGYPVGASTGPVPATFRASEPPVIVRG